MPRAVWRSMLVCLACALAQGLRAQEIAAATDQPLDAMLLPPVDGQLALWVNQPANFAVVGVAPEHGAAILYQQTALEGVPASGYIYVPPGDAGYDRVYLVASKDPLDLSGTLDDAMSSASVLDAYATDTVLDAYRCPDGRLLLAVTEIDKETRARHVLREEQSEGCRVPGPNRERLASPYMFAAGRGFFFPTRPTPTHKSLPPGFKPPKVEPKPGPRLEPADSHALRWLAAKDEWHAVTHNGQPGTELPRALGYVQYGSVWILGRRNLALEAHKDEVRKIVNGTVGGVPSRNAYVMQQTGQIATVHLASSRSDVASGSSPLVYVVAPNPEVRVYRSSDGTWVGGYSGIGPASGGYAPSPGAASYGIHQAGGGGYSPPTVSSHEPVAPVLASPGGHH